MPRVVGSQGSAIVLADGRQLEVASIVWATGFHPDFRWVQRPVFDAEGLPRHQRSVVPGEPGLYFLGLRRLARLNSSLLNGVGADAAHLTATIAPRVTGRPDPRPDGPPRFPQIGRRWRNFWIRRLLARTPPDATGLWADPETPAQYRPLRSRPNPRPSWAGSDRRIDLQPPAAPLTCPPGEAMQYQRLLSVVGRSLIGILVLGLLLADSGAPVDAQAPAPAPAAVVTVTADSGPTGTTATIRVTGPPGPLTVFIGVGAIIGTTIPTNGANPTGSIDISMTFYGPPSRISIWAVLGTQINGPSRGSAVFTITSSPTNPRPLTVTAAPNADPNNPIGGVTVTVSGVTPGKDVELSVNGTPLGRTARAGSNGNAVFTGVPVSGRTGQEGEAVPIGANTIGADRQSGGGYYRIFNGPTEIAASVTPNMGIEKTPAPGPTTTLTATGVQVGDTVTIFLPSGMIITTATAQNTNAMGLFTLAPPQMPAFEDPPGRVPILVLVGNTPPFKVGVTSFLIKEPPKVSYLFGDPGDSRLALHGSTILDPSGLTVEGATDFPVNVAVVPGGLLIADPLASGVPTGSGLVSLVPCDSDSPAQSFNGTPADCLGGGTFDVSRLATETARGSGLNELWGDWFIIDPAADGTTSVGVVGQLGRDATFRDLNCDGFNCDPNALAGGGTPGALQFPANGPNGHVLPTPPAGTNAGGTGYTFYGRYVTNGNPDNREPLGTTWGSRLLDGGAVNQLSATQAPALNDLWIFSSQGAVSFYAWDPSGEGALELGLTITGPGTFGASFGIYSTDIAGATAGLNSAPGALTCTLGCLWVTAPAALPGEDSAVYLLDLERIPPEGATLDADPAADWVQRIDGIPNGHRGIGADMHDLNGDGFPDLIIGLPAGSPDDLDGDPSASDERGVAYVLQGPLTAGALSDKVARTYGGAQPGEQFGGDVELADINGDGRLEVIITSRLHQKNNIGSLRGAAFVFEGAPPVIEGLLLAEEGVLTIIGSNLDANVRVDGQPAIILSYSDQEIRVSPAGNSVEVIGVFGAAQASRQRTLDLGSGFNLVGWTGATPIAEALATLDGAFSGVFTWDPLTQTFRSFRPDAPAFLNSLDELLLGDGLWIEIDGPGATWSQPDFDAARSVDLAPGLQLAIWTGPDGAAVADAIAGIAGAVVQILTWDAAAQQFRTFNASLPQALNSLSRLDYGAAFWIEVDAAVTWQQPAR